MRQVTENQLLTIELRGTAEYETAKPSGLRLPLAALAIFPTTLGGE